MPRKFKITSPSGKSYLITAPDGATNEQIQSKLVEFKQKISASEPVINPPSTENLYRRPDLLSRGSRVALQTMGSMGGATAGAPLGPAGIFAGGALGYAGGSSAADLIDRLRGMKPPLATLQRAAKETVGNIAEGAVAEGGGLVLSKFAGAPAVKKFLRTRSAAMGELMSGVKKESGERLFNDPGALFTRSSESTGAEVGALRKELRLVYEPTPAEIVDPEGKIASDIFEKTIKSMRDINKVPNNKISPHVQKMVNSKFSASRLRALAEKIPSRGFNDLEESFLPRAEQPIYALTEGLSPNNKKEALLFAAKRKEAMENLTHKSLIRAKQAANYLIQKEKYAPKQRYQSIEAAKIQSLLNDLSPEERAASSEAARSYLGEKFRKLLPVTSTGAISKMRTTIIPSLIGGGSAYSGMGGRGILPALGFIASQSPALSGAAIAATGATQKLLANPNAARVISDILTSAIRQYRDRQKKEKKND